MPLEPVKLDDLTWSDLTTTARNRIAAVSGGDWTLHAPVDPGITLLELFAAQLEQRSYMLDQPSQPLTAALLKLAGVHPKPVGIAATVLSFGGAGQPDTKPVSLEPLVMKLDQDENLAIQTQRSFTWIPVCDQQPRRRHRVDKQQPVSLRVQDVDRTMELQSGRLPCLFAATGDVRESTVVIWLRNWNYSGSSEVTLSILFDLETPEGVEPQWVHESRFDADGTSHNAGCCITCSKGEQTPSSIMSPARTADVSWAYQFGDAGFSDVKLVEDGTNGFRRSGIVRLTLPDLTPPKESGIADPGRTGILPGHADLREAVALSIRIRAANVSYSFLPRVRQIAPNAVIALHKRIVQGRQINGVPEQDRTPQKPLAMQLSESSMQELADQMFAWRPLPENRLQLPPDDFQDKVIPQATLPPHDDLCKCGHVEIRSPVSAVKLRLRERGVSEQVPGKWPEWSGTRDFGQHGPADRFFAVDRPRGVLSFGDGLTGRIPIPARFRRQPTDHHEQTNVEFEIEYEVGGGTKGNQPAGMKWTSIEPNSTTPQGQPGAWNAVNVVASTGGAEPQSLDDAVRDARLLLNQPTRAVTQVDMETLARLTPGVGVARAHAAVGFIEQHRCLPVPGAVTVFIVPGLPASLRRFRSRTCGDDLVALRPEPDTVDAVSRWLNQRRLITHEILVASPRYVDVELSVRIEGTPIDVDSLRESVSETLHESLHPLYGGPDGTGWPFGGPLRPSELVKRVQDSIDDDLHVASVSVGLPDSDSARVTVAGCVCTSAESHDSNPGESRPEEPAFEHCRDVPIPRDALVALRRVDVTFDRPVHSDAGGLL